MKAVSSSCRPGRWTATATRRHRQLRPRNHDCLYNPNWYIASKTFTHGCNFSAMYQLVIEAVVVAWSQLTMTVGLPLPSSGRAARTRYRLHSRSKDSCFRRRCSRNRGLVDRKPTRVDPGVVPEVVHLHVDELFIVNVLATVAL